MTNKNYSLNEFEKNAEKLVDDYFNSYTEYNESTINEYFTDLFYNTNSYEDMDLANEAEQQIRNIVFNGGIKNATQHKNKL